MKTRKYSGKFKVAWSSPIGDLKHSSFESKSANFTEYNEAVELADEKGTVVEFNSGKKHPEFNWHVIYVSNNNPGAINVIKRELEITQNDIANFFGYKDGGSYARSARKNHIDNGIIDLFNLIKRKFTEKLI